MSKIIRAVLRF